MLTLRLSGDTQELEPGLKLLANELFFREGTGQYSLHAVKSELPGFSITVKNDSAQVRYHQKTDFYRSLPIFVQHAAETEYTVEEAPCFDKTGVMLDCSRNAVPTVDSVKNILRKMALMGLNLGMLYTEDTYEIKNQPYFGYMRGRYSFEELKELDDYADTLGIELIPCIQTLAHLERALQWPALEHLRDAERVLMVGEEETYTFIEELITAASAPYRSNRIHIGMDEAWELGLGRYLNKKGYRPCGELMKEHLERVDAILKKHHLHAMMWSDMHFTAASPTRDLYDVNAQFTPEILAGAPENIDLVYWDYYNEQQEHYEKLLNMHGLFSAKTIFAGGIWTWTGPATDYRKTVQAALPALKACKKCGIKEVIATAWGDDGAEANLQTILYGMQLFAEFSYTGQYNEKQACERFEVCCRIPGKAFLDLSLFNEIPGIKLMEQSTVTPAKTLLYEDPLIPSFEEDFRDLPYTEHYRILIDRFKNYAAIEPEYRLLFDFYAKFADAIYHKCLWRDRAVACVRAKNREEAAEVSAFADTCIQSIRALKGAWSSLWYTTNKPYGYEVNDLRISGLIGRFETAKFRLNQFAVGEIADIPELSEPKLPYLRNEDGTFRCVNSWGAIATVCRIVG